MRISRLQFVWDVGVVTSHTAASAWEAIDRGEGRGEGHHSLIAACQLGRCRRCRRRHKQRHGGECRCRAGRGHRVECVSSRRVVRDVERNAKSSCLATESVQREVPVSERVFAHRTEKARGDVHWCNGKGDIWPTRSHPSCTWRRRADIGGQVNRRAQNGKTEIRCEDAPGVSSTGCVQWCMMHTPS